MGFLVRDDEYDESKRMTGFRRYKQLLSFFAGHWTKLNLITFLSAIPYIAGLFFSYQTSSLLILVPSSFVGGMIIGPFFAGLVDSIQRGLREDTNNRWENYKKGLKQNFTCSLLPGGLTGLVVGIYFYLLSLWNWGAISLQGAPLFICIVSFVLFLIIEILYWPQLVLFKLPFIDKMRNTILFSCKYLWKIFLAILVPVVFFGLVFVFSPYMLIILPFIGFWFPSFVGQLILYEDLNAELRIEELFETTE